MPRPTVTRPFSIVPALLAVALAGTADAVPIHDFSSDFGEFSSRTEGMEHISFDEPFENVRIAEQRSGFTYYESFEIEGVGFRPWRRNSNVPGILTRDNFARLGRESQYDMFGYPGGTNSLNALSASIEIDFTGLDRDVNSFGVYWGSWGAAVPCCVTQSMTFELESGAQFSVNPRTHLGRIATIRQATPDFLSVMIPNDPIRTVRFRQHGNGAVLSHLYFGSVGPVATVPEPAALGLAGLGLASSGAFRGRRLQGGDRPARRLR